MLVDFDILTVIIGFIIFIIIALIFKLKLKRENIYILFCFIMFLYILNVAKLTLFPFPIFSDWYEANLFESINLIPFDSILNKESLYNILMMMPLGFGLPFVSKINNWKKIIIAAIFSGLIIESLQFIIAITISKGFTFRFIDIDDIICNFIGTIIGFCILKVFSKAFLKLLKYDNSSLDKFWDYIFNISGIVIQFEQDL
ncbi:VanZ family protein [Anaerovorax odorimutans]|uniref:VanZ family protein n=1 Tax=Anaerovorax odorimutans TaxID=109327 RepID=UPI0003FDB0C7|nr:VanZ family protein [Anaerovorax odorimutans]